MTVTHHLAEILRARPASSENLADLALVVSFAAYTILILLVLAAARIQGGKGWRDLLAWRPFHLGRTFWLLVAATLIYSVAADLVLKHLYPPSESWFPVPSHGPRAIAFLALAVIWAPVAEELIFRGYLYTVLRRFFGLAAALVATSAIFAGLHYEGTHLYSLVVFPVGIALGLIRETTGSVKPGIAFHAFNNFFASAFALFDVLLRP